MDDFFEVVDICLESDDEYLKQKVVVEVVECMVFVVVEKVWILEQDRQEKGQVYEVDLLFLYFWYWDFGILDYDKCGLMWFLDCWVVGFICFEDVCVNYVILIGILEKMVRYVDYCV